MIINKYRASNLEAAIDKARAELGTEARVLHVRELDKYLVPGMKQPGSDNENIEIIVATDDEADIGSSANVGGNAESIREKVQDPMKSGQDLLRNSISQTDTHAPNTAPKHILENATSAYGEMFLRNLEEQISEDDVAVDINNMDGAALNNMEPPYARFKRGEPLAEPETPGDKPDQKIPARNDSQKRILTETRRRVNRESNELKNKERILQILNKSCSRNQVDADITYEILSLLDSERSKIGIYPEDESRPMTARDYMSHFISRRINMSDGLDTSKRISILIGPTGVGKTTTLAKLAAEFQFQQQKAVGLITIDAYRIAAIEQLKTYSQIMSIPLKVALTPGELRQCISDYSDMDLILVDTPGRSQFNTGALGTLQEFLEVAQPADTHLLIAVSTRENDAYAIVDSFAPQYVRQLIFTKLDETSSLGPILNISTKIGKPISYLTTGQNVPDDIENAQVERMADLFLNDKHIGR